MRNKRCFIEIIKREDQLRLMNIKM